MLLQKTRLAAKTLGVSVSTLKKWRSTGLLTEGIHYHKQGYNLLLFNTDLLSHWLQTRNQPDLHDRKIQEYLSSLEPETAKGKRKAA